MAQRISSEEMPALTAEQLAILRRYIEDYKVDPYTEHNGWRYNLDKTANITDAGEQWTGDGGIAGFEYTRPDPDGKYSRYGGLRDSYDANGNYIGTFLADNPNQSRQAAGAALAAFGMPVAGALGGTLGASGSLASGIGGALIGGASSAVSGGNPLRGAILGGIGGYAGSELSDLFREWNVNPDEYLGWSNESGLTPAQIEQMLVGGSDYVPGSYVGPSSVGPISEVLDTVGSASPTQIEITGSGVGDTSGIGGLAGTVSDIPSQSIDIVGPRSEGTTKESLPTLVTTSGGTANVDSTKQADDNNSPTQIEITGNKFPNADLIPVTDPSWPTVTFDPVTATSTGADTKTNTKDTSTDNKDKTSGIPDWLTKLLPVIGALGGRGSNGNTPNGADQSQLTANAPAALNRQYQGPPSGYRAGIDPEWKYFTGIGATSPNAVSTQPTSTGNKMPTDAEIKEFYLANQHDPNIIANAMQVNNVSVNDLVRAMGWGSTPIAPDLPAGGSAPASIPQAAPTSVPGSIGPNGVPNLGTPPAGAMAGGAPVTQATTASYDPLAHVSQGSGNKTAGLGASTNATLSPQEIEAFYRQNMNSPAALAEGMMQYGLTSDDLNFAADRLGIRNLQQFSSTPNAQVLDPVGLLNNPTAEGLAAYRQQQEDLARRAESNPTFRVATEADYVQPQPFVTQDPAAKSLNYNIYHDANLANARGENFDDVRTRMMQQYGLTREAFDDAFMTQHRSMYGSPQNPVQQNATGSLQDQQNKTNTGG